MTSCNIPSRDYGPQNYRQAAKHKNFALICCLASGPICKCVIDTLVRTYLVPFFMLVTFGVVSF